MPRKSMILVSCSPLSAWTAARRGVKFSEYQAVRSAPLLMVSGRGRGDRSKAPAATASRKRTSTGDGGEDGFGDPVFVIEVGDKAGVE
jgi:hypothetical protein